MEVSFFVPGMAVPQGSKRAMVHRNSGKVVMFDTSDKRMKQWRSDIKTMAVTAMSKNLWTGPVAVCLCFVFPRPNGHFGTGRRAGVLKPSAPAWKTTTPDVDKLSRAVLDALTGSVFLDDKQVVKLTASKGFAEKNEQFGVHVSAVRIDAEDPPF